MTDPGRGRTAVHLHGDLADLGGGADHEVAATEPRSVKDLVESLGVPHTEVGAIAVDAAPVGFAHLVHGGEVVDVHGVGAQAVEMALRGTPPDPRRFVCDVHLGTLARRLRLLGFDTWYRREADDALLTDVAVGEGRILLTRDRGLLRRRAVVHGQLPRSDDPDTQLVEVVGRYDLASRARPLTRCIPCNGPLEPVATGQVLDRLPPRTRLEHDRFVRCSECGQVFWPGSHRAPIARLVARATAGSSGAASSR